MFFLPSPQLFSSESPDVSLGASVQLEGLLVTSSHPKQPVELAVSSINVLGSCDSHVSHLNG